MNTTLTIEDVRRKAPSVFAPGPYEKQSAKYQFISTADVLQEMIKAGLYPVRASQSRSRIEGKAEFTKHMIRLRLSGRDNPALNEVIPEVILTNSHDGTASYKVFFGLFRLICLNGAVVNSGSIEDIRVRHSGDRQVIDHLVNHSLNIFKNIDPVLNQVSNWKSRILEWPDQLRMAEEAININKSKINIEPRGLLRAFRTADFTQENSRRDLWRTYNVIQENIIKGGVYGRNEQGRLMRTRRITAVDRDISVNRKLWELAEKFYNQN